VFYQYPPWATCRITRCVELIGYADSEIYYSKGVPAKTPAMGVPISNVMFVGILAITSSKIQIPMVIFQGFQIAFGSVLTIFFRKWTGTQKDKRLASEEMV